MLCSLHLKSTKRFWNTVSKTTATLVITPSREADQLSFKAFYRENPHLQCLWETGFSLRLFTNHEDTHFSCLSVGSLSGSIILGDKASGRFKVNSWGKWPYSKRIQCPSPARVGSQTGVEDRVIPLEGPWGREGSFWEVFGRRLTSRTRLGPPLLVPFCPHTSEDEKVKPLSSWEELTHFPPSPRLRGAEGVHGGARLRSGFLAGKGLLPAHVRTGQVEPRQDLGTEGLAATDGCILVPAFSPTLEELVARQNVAQPDYWVTH